MTDKPDKIAKNKPGPPKGSRNALQGDGADGYLHTRINGKVKEKAKRDAEKRSLSLAKHVEDLLRRY